MKLAALVLCIVLSSCASRSHPTTTADNVITPRGEMPEQFRVRSMFSTPDDQLLNRYNKFAEKINLWVWDYARGRNNVKAAREAARAFRKFTNTPGYAPSVKPDPCEVQ